MWLIFDSRLTAVRNNANIYSERHAENTCRFHQDDPKTVPVLNWLASLPPKALDKCRVRIERLRDLGHELRRPESDFLRDGIYELRIKLGTVNYRILYFFHGRVAAVLAHGLVKESEVPKRDIELALQRKRKFELDPERHTFKE